MNKNTLAAISILLLAIATISIKLSKSTLLPGVKVIYHYNVYVVTMMKIDTKTKRTTLSLSGGQLDVPADSVKLLHVPTIWERIAN